MELSIVLALLLVYPLYLLVRDIKKRRRRAALSTTPFPKEWEDILFENMAIYEKLPEALKKELQWKAMIFMEEKNFEGCNGITITDEIKVTIAAQAVMLLLNKNIDIFPKLTTVLVYPSTYVASQAVLSEAQRTESDVPVAGQSYSDGTVILAWNHVLGGGKNDKDGHNVVFHEFAHQLDQADGYADGMPILEKKEQYKPWISIVGKEFEEFLAKVTRGRKDVIDEYGATNAAEFFAVVTETFFEKPQQLERKHPALFNEFKEYYRMNPLEW